ncbi:hypothetical protein Ahy_B05g076807 [Arachis hypogaea]|uniref:Uncharacterized protein n=1 Tax=Arachis hypogaea TaxID=3818 RepID=A0A444Z401_ARAHY|nr:hypothetical protein Ahy_B05g076807 [Arachis hypogaea]
MDWLQAIVRQKEQEEAQKTYEDIMANLAKIKATFESWDSCNKQSTSTDKCEKSTEEWCRKKILESQNEDKERGYVLQQVEEKEIVEKEEVFEELKKVEQEVDFKLENTSTPSDVVNDFVEVVDLSSIELENDVEEDNVQLPRHSNEEEIKLKESHQEEDVEVEESCKEVEVIMEEHKGVELARSLEPPLLKSPSNTTFKWVKFLSLSFTFSLECGLIENDGQLRALCGVKSMRELCSSGKNNVRLIMVEPSRHRSHG